MTGAELIAAERERQIAQEGYTPEHDARVNGDSELLQAALCYGAAVANPRHYLARPSRAWPWDATQWKPTGDPVRDLVKMGALVAAEIDRIQGLTAKAS